MQTIKVSGEKNNQFIQIPKEYYISEKELFIRKIGNTIVLISKEKPYELFKKSLYEFSKDFLSSGRQQPKMQKRGQL
jgi:antitoxin VapB